MKGAVLVSDEEEKRMRIRGMICLHIYVCVDSRIKIPCVEVNGREIRVLAQEVPVRELSKSFRSCNCEKSYHAARIRVARSLIDLLAYKFNF